MKSHSAESQLIAHERPAWYLKDKVTAGIVWIIGTVGGLLFLLPALKYGEYGRSDVAVLLLTGAAIFFCGVLGLLAFVSRNRLAIFNDHVVLPWSIPTTSSVVPFGEMRSLRLTRDSAGWLCAWETKSGGEKSLRLSGIENLQSAVELLARVSGSSGPSAVPSV